MIVKALQLQCDNCKDAHFPEGGSADGNLCNVQDLRRVARTRLWTRTVDDHGVLRDHCPRCSKKEAC